jgi:hypothetical protein
VRLAFVVELHRAAQVKSVELDPADHQVKGDRLVPDLEFLHVPLHDFWRRVWSHHNARVLGGGSDEADNLNKIRRRFCTLISVNF